MVNISSQTTLTSGRAQNYAKKDSVAISALSASVPLFEKRLQEIRVRHGKDGMLLRPLKDAKGTTLRDAVGDSVPGRDTNGRPIYQSKYIQAYCLVQSFGRDELDPDDPESWTRANKLGRAFAEDRFPGHPALIATETNGRSGCVHNHIIVGAVHPETGRSIDSNVVTHSRLAIAHDRVLAEQGFAQRADMAQKTRTAEQAIAVARARVLADPATAALSPNRRQRKLTAAENAVRLQHDSSTSVTQARDARRMREFDRYQLTERDRMIAVDIGMAPPAERFSEIELEARVKETLSDPRFRSWDKLAAVAREHGITIAARGPDVSFGMMLAQPDGTLAEPARAHLRRGGRPSTGKGLGDGFRREDVEAAIERNVREHERSEQPTVEKQSSALTLEHERRMDERKEKEPALIEKLQAESDSAWASTTGATEPEPEPKLESGADEPRKLPFARRRITSPAPAMPEAPAPSFRSELWDLPAPTDSRRRRLHALAQFEERWHDRLPSTAEERTTFEQQATAIGIGPALLTHADGHMDPELHALLTARASQAEERRRAFERARRLTEEIAVLEKQVQADPYGFRDGADRLRVKLRTAKADGRFESGYIERLDADRAVGIYESRSHERREHIINKNSARVVSLETKEREDEGMSL